MSDAKAEKKLLLVEYYEDFGRGGELQGLFITTPEILEKLKGREVYLGEALGKHSEVYASLNDNTLKVRSENPEAIRIIRECFGPSKYGHVLGTDVLGQLADDIQWGDRDEDEDAEGEPSAEWLVVFPRDVGGAAKPGTESGGGE